MQEKHAQLLDYARPMPQDRIGGGYILLLVLSGLSAVYSVFVIVALLFLDGSGIDGSAALGAIFVQVLIVTLPAFIYADSQRLRVPEKRLSRLVILSVASPVLMFIALLIGAVASATAGR